MKRRPVFPATVRSFYLPYADESIARQVFAEFSPVSERNFCELQRLFATEIGVRQFSFGYSRAAATGRWLSLASTRDSDDVIGYAASVTLESFGRFHGLITDLAVLPEYRRQGVAQSLIMGVGAVLSAQQDPHVSALAAIVPARRHEALDTFTIAGFENIVKGEEYLFTLPLNRAPAHC